MDLNNIKNIIIAGIKSGFKSIRNILKEAVKLPYAKIYILIAFLLTFIFVIITLPYNVFIRNSIMGLEKHLFKSVYVSDIDFNFIGDSSIDNINLTLLNDSEITLNDIRINPSLNPIKLFIMNIYDADIGINTFKYKSEQVKLNFSINGNLYLDMDSKTGYPENGKIKLMIHNAVIVLDQFNLPDSMGGMPISMQPIRLASMIFHSEIADNKINIKSAKFSGNDLRGNIHGKISLVKMLKHSKLDLKISIDPASQALNSYKDFLTGYIKNNSLLILIKGKLSSPGIKLQKQSD